MLDEPPKGDDFRSTLAMIRENVELEARLIDELLDVSRIAQGKMHFKRELVDVHRLIFRAVETCRDAIQDGRFHRTLGLSAAKRHVVADPMRLQ